MKTLTVLFLALSLILSCKEETNNIQCTYIPADFSPNGDGINDVLLIIPEQYIEIIIVNKNDETLFIAGSTDTIKWNGIFYGSILPVDTYYYFGAEICSGKNNSISGEIKLTE